MLNIHVFGRKFYSRYWLVSQPHNITQSNAEQSYIHIHCWLSHSIHEADKEIKWTTLESAQLKLAVPQMTRLLRQQSWGWVSWWRWQKRLTFPLGSNTTDGAQHALPEQGGVAEGCQGAGHQGGVAKGWLESSPWPHQRRGACMYSALCHQRICIYMLVSYVKPYMLWGWWSWWRGQW